jgi:hypothetical protein
MEDFEKNALDSATLKPKCWFRYVDDTFVVWQHGRQNLDAFLDHLNSQHENIKFTMEIEVNGTLPFLDVLVSRKTREKKLGHTVYRKRTHTNRYLNASSHHHPAQIESVAKTLAIRSKRIADADHINEEYNTLKLALLQNGFSNSTITRAWNRQAGSRINETETGASAYVPYVKGTTDRIKNVLSRFNIRTIFTTDLKIGAMLGTVKDKVHLDNRGVYEIPCTNCNKTYIGQTGRKMSHRMQEHRLNVKQFEKTSALAQHVVDELHVIDFKNAKSLATLNILYPRMVREAIEIEKRPQNMNNQKDSLKLPQAWKPVLGDLQVIVEPRQYVQVQVSTSIDVGTGLKTAMIAQEQGASFGNDTASTQGRCRTVTRSQSKATSSFK